MNTLYAFNPLIKLNKFEMIKLMLEIYIMLIILCNFSLLKLAYTHIAIKYIKSYLFLKFYTLEEVYNFKYMVLLGLNNCLNKISIINRRHKHFICK